jgi:tripartite-type tricarboxylate transporter receptor subunit TctC
MQQIVARCRVERSAADHSGGTMHRRTFLQIALYGALCSPAFATEDYPARPITIIVPFAVGGPNDVVSRLLAEWLQTELKQTVVVDNKGGAGGTLGAGLAARAKPDGYTLMVATTATISIAPYLYKDLPYDPAKDFAPVSRLTTGPLVLGVSRSVPVHNVAELIAYAKQRPGELAFGSPGFGSIPHLAGELFQQATGTKFTHVPYSRGGATDLNDLVGGHIQVVFEAGSSILALHNQIRLLAVTGTKRLAVLPDVPTVQESGVAGYDVEFWNALFAPAGTPAPIIARLLAAVTTVMNTPAAADAIGKLGLTPAVESGAQFEARMTRDAKMWQTAAKSAGIVPQ